MFATDGTRSDPELTNEGAIDGRFGGQTIVMQTVAPLQQQNSTMQNNSGLMSVKSKNMQSRISNSDLGDLIKATDHESNQQRYDALGKVIERIDVIQKDRESRESKQDKSIKT